MARWTLAVVMLLCLLSPILATGEDAYRLDTGDVLELSVWGHDDLDARVTVGPDGMISLPLVGEICVRGATLAEVERLAVARLAELVRDPQVTVTLVARRQISVKVFGEVRNPGAFLVHPGTSIAESIAMAGGPTDRAALEEVRLLKRGDPSTAVVVPQGKGDHFGLGAPVRGPELSDGDVIFVPETRRIDWEFVFAVLGGLLTLKQLLS